MQQIAWEDFLHLSPSFVGGGIESVEGDVLFKGTITAIEERRGEVVFETGGGCSRVDLHSGLEERSLHTSNSIGKGVKPLLGEDGRVMMFIPGCGLTVLSPAHLH